MKSVCKKKFLLAILLAVPSFSISVESSAQSTLNNDVHWWARTVLGVYTGFRVIRYMQRQIAIKKYESLMQKWQAVADYTNEVVYYSKYGTLGSLADAVQGNIKRKKYEAKLDLLNNNLIYKNAIKAKETSTLSYGKQWAWETFKDCFRIF